MESSKFTIGGGARRNSSFCFAFDVLSGGGILYVVPTNVLSSDVLLDAMLRDELGAVGLSKEFIAQMMAEEEIGSGIVEIEVISPCCEEEPNALPKVISVLPVILEWIESVASERVSFYSAREEQEAFMQQQLSAVMTQQEALAKSSLHVAVAGYADPVPEQPGGLQALRAPSLSAGIMGGTAPKQAANLSGPPPRTKAAGQTPVPDVEALAVPIPGPCVGGGDGQMLGAISQQTLAIMQLVAHLVGGVLRKTLHQAQQHQALG